MSYTDWKIPYSTTIVPQELLDAGYSALLAAVLNVRGLGDPEQARAFLECDDALLGDPLMMTDMPQAVMRITRAIALGETVAVYGDYDVDGITSTCMMTDYLRKKGVQCEYYIPDRMEEGYGINTAAIESLRAKGVSLIITVDCGVTTVEEAAFAASIGIDMIVTDHHECREELPDVIAVVDPKRPDCNYPSRDLAGVGVAFKLLCALEGSAEPILEEYADLVAVGTIADVMPLVGENRYIIKHGLRKLMTSPRPGLRALIEEAGLGDKRITATNIGFTLAPRLNASGRLGQASMAAELLLTDSPRTAASRAADLCQLNRDRQMLETDIWKQAQEMIGDAKPDRPIVLSCETWHQGVIGIAASRLTEAFNVPAIMICLDGDKGKGSCRSCGGFNLFEALSACSEHLEGFGGHALAAGLTITRENIPAFTEAIGEYYLANPGQGEKSLDIDLCADSPELLTMPCVEDLELMEPCGTGNARPTLCMTRAYLSSMSPIGGGRHLRLLVEKFGHSYECVFFSRTAAELGVQVGSWVDIAFFPQ
ncbi:MAG: single-stranded-DNA-specific exonuclease RecJ, partial [Oscillospiraceae bacterium]|nr:single-stranded-DNA-specific exonuclease RecJ [Oscillospiraceae bacterium]